MSMGRDSSIWASDSSAGESLVPFENSFTEAGLRRRDLIRNGVSLFALTSGAGGLLWLRRTTKLRVMESTLERTVEAGMQSLGVEQGRHVQAAVQRLRDYLHGPPLEMYRFAEEVCSVAFAERLAGIPTEEERQQAILSVFERRVISPAALADRVRQITTELAAPFSDHWNKCCQYVWHAWRGPTRSIETSALLTTELTTHLEQRMRAVMRETARQAEAGTTGRGLLTGFADVTSTLISVWPIVSAGTGIGWLVIAAPALLQLASVCLGWLARASVSDLKRLASEQYSFAARQIVVDFETELSRRIALLAHEQRQTLIGAARLRAEEAVGWL